jgi:carbon-monoxide dehydrogenase medium subunit
MMWQDYKLAASIGDALDLLAEYRGKARIAAGTTDLILELERGVRPEVNLLIDITRIPGIDQISLDEKGFIHLGPMVTHNDCIASKLICEQAFLLAQACWQVGSPQIRNRGTIAGNLVTASPANDTIPPLMALGANVRLGSSNRERVVPLRDFYTGVRRTVMEPDEMLLDIFFPKLVSSQKSVFTKFGLRKAQAIAMVNAAIVLSFDSDIISDASITLGSVAPTVVHADEMEKFLIGKTLTETTITKAVQKVSQASKPISDLRGTDRYRERILQIILSRSLNAIALQNEKEGFPVDPVFLSTSKSISSPPPMIEINQPIVCKINGKDYQFSEGHNKTLLRILREDGLLIGTKEGCAEGECGACTVYLDGEAVMSCLVPAPRAHGAEIVTIEGIGQDQLHPVQEAFIEKGAVQCGYCTPGFIMSAVKLLEEKTNPTVEQIKQSITGNLCRCTGYYSIVEAIEAAANQQRS